jgi:hypothetical protein
VSSAEAVGIAALAAAGAAALLAAAISLARRWDALAWPPDLGDAVRFALGLTLAAAAFGWVGSGSQRGSIEVVDARPVSCWTENPAGRRGFVHVQLDAPPWEVRWRPIAEDRARAEEACAARGPLRLVYRASPGELPIVRAVAHADGRAILREEITAERERRTLGTTAGVVGVLAGAAATALGACGAAWRERRRAGREALQQGRARGNWRA